MLLTGGGAAELYFEPSSFELEATAGDTVQRNFTVFWTGQNATTAELKYNIAANRTNTEGVTMTLSDTYLFLPPNSNQTENLTIETDYALKPDNFTINISGSAELENTTESVSNRSSGGGKGGGGGSSQPKDNDTAEQPSMPENSTDEGSSDGNKSEPENSDEGSQSEESSETGELETGKVFDRAGQVARNPFQNPVPVTVFFILLGLLTVLIYFGYENYKERKRAKQRQMPEEEVVDFDENT